ncbi:MAG: prepilin-type N-terminal cleavage/methylation domain-containing protein [Planctomycetes bacterium]|nr:prepilin-type N-terminal cleavage/methylation domain-containing protein [Planctomycetota bacterium]
MPRNPKKAFTIVELLVVVSIIALLIGILLPAIGKARDKARTSTSISNLRQLATAHNAYAGDWEDSQLSLARYNISLYEDMAAYNGAIGYSGGSYSQGHPPLIAGWGIDPDSGTSQLFAYWPAWDQHYWAVEPIGFPGGAGVNGFGWFRLPNVKQLSQYVGGRWYDKVYYAPKDPFSHIIEPCLDNPSEAPTTAECSPPIWSTYCLSPASLFSPAVMRAENPQDGQDHNSGWQDPWDVPAGHRTPKMGSIRYPTLKTHMLEHPWLQNVRTICNPSFTGPWNNACEPYWFNHGFESAPATLFYDGSARLMGTQEAMNANRRVFGNTEIGLWSRDTPFNGSYAPGSGDGYFSSYGYDFTSTSYHILTTDGALGRDTLGSEQ